MIYLELFLTFFKIGLFTFGGGYAMLPLIQEEVIAYNWLDMGTLFDFVAVSESTPGPFAINIATYIGTVQGGVLGAVCATLGVVMPSFIVILIVAQIYEKFKKSKAVKGIMTGLRPAVVGLIGATLLSVFMSVFFPAGFVLSVFTELTTYIHLLIVILALVLIFKKVHPIYVVGISALLGILTGYIFGL